MTNCFLFFNFPNVKVQKREKESRKNQNKVHFVKYIMDVSLTLTATVKPIVQMKNLKF